MHLFQKIIEAYFSAEADIGFEFDELVKGVHHRHGGVAHLMLTFERAFVLAVQIVIPDASAAMIAVVHPVGEALGKAGVGPITGCHFSHLLTDF